MPKAPFSPWHGLPARGPRGWAGLIRHICVGASLRRLSEPVPVGPRVPRKRLRWNTPSTVCAQFLGVLDHRPDLAGGARDRL